jgi:hypothetical protein
VADEQKEQVEWVEDELDGERVWLEWMLKIEQHLLGIASVSSYI